MKMKKLLSVILSAAVISSAAMLASCGGSGTPAETTDEGGMAGREEPLIMATNAYFPPYEYHEGNEIVGIDVEIANAIADKLGRPLQIEDVEFDSVLAGVQSGKYDMGLAGITVTPERQQSMDFTDSYATAVQSIIVKDDSPITSPDDLAADGATYQVGVQLSTTGDIMASDTFGADRVQQFQAGADAVAALSAGKIDCVIIDNEPAKSFVAANDGLKILDTEYAVEEYAACVAKDSPILEDLNNAIAELKADGTIDSIIEKYIPAE